MTTLLSYKFTKIYFVMWVLFHFYERLYRRKFKHSQTNHLCQEQRFYLTLTFTLPCRYVKQINCQFSQFIAPYWEVHPRIELRYVASYKGRKFVRKSIVCCLVKICRLRLCEVVKQLFPSTMYLQNNIRPVHVLCVSVFTVT